jgi:UDP-3-O-[3-hydroxymyristoyl] glucosamine N-acyltransferase
MANEIVMRKIKVKEILPLLSDSDRVVGNTEYYFTNIQTANRINEESLDWINPRKQNKHDILLNSKAKIIICGKDVYIPDEAKNTKCLIIADNPKLTFLRIANNYFIETIEYSIHPTATIHPDAVISERCSIGPYTYIGKSTIGDETVIFSHCNIYDNVTIGKNVIIKSCTVIGTDGFGYVRSEDGSFEKFPHIGGVIIKDYVEIGANTCIDKGALGFTIIEEGVKIDNLVQISHNVKVGKHSAVVSHVSIGGSTSIGEYSWIAPSAILKDNLKIGNQSTIGMGAIVTRDVPDGETWAGIPARPLNRFSKFKSGE